MSNIKIGKLEIALLRKISEKNGRASSYALFRKLKIPISDLMNSIFFLRENGLILVDNDNLKITGTGITLLLNFSSEKHRTTIPEKMIRKVQIEPNTPYIPSRVRLDKKVFKVSHCGILKRGADGS